MNATLTHAKKKLGGLVCKAQSGVETGADKRSSPAAKLVPAGRRSAVLTAQWRARRKAILLNPKGLPRLSLAMLIQESRK
jgi:antitoxin (DNA-binding transcriptional repressor) of toxin-antitoxin stability system